jgi:flagellar motility protein MotE (MotC chaperone)
MEMEAEKPTFNAFERFLYWFFIPIVFTMVLIGALLSLFDYNIMNEFLKVGDKVPGLSAVLPDPKVEGKPAVKNVLGEAEPAESEVNPETVINELRLQLAGKEAELKSADDAYHQKDQALKDLQAKMNAMQVQTKEDAKSDEEYQALIRETASMYAKMSPSKAAPIMQNLTLSEQVLLLSEMKLDERVGILEKMDPKKAAEASIYLKDAVPAKDKQIAALQERLKLNNSVQPAAAAKLSKDDLGQTFANMTPKSAAALLIEMEKTTPAKVTDILNSVDSAARSKIMSSLSDASKETAASIAARLVP